MSASCGPHQRKSGKRELRTVPMLVRRVCDHSSGGPSGVFDQSLPRMSAAISPAPARIRLCSTSTTAPTLYCHEHSIWPSLQRSTRDLGKEYVFDVPAGRTGPEHLRDETEGAIVLAMGAHVPRLRRADGIDDCRLPHRGPDARNESACRGADRDSRPIRI